MLAKIKEKSNMSSDEHKRVDGEIVREKIICEKKKQTFTTNEMFVVGAIRLNPVSCCIKLLFMSVSNLRYVFFFFRCCHYSRSNRQFFLIFVNRRSYLEVSLFWQTNPQNDDGDRYSLAFDEENFRQWIKTMRLDARSIIPESIRRSRYDDFAKTDSYTLIWTIYALLYLLLYEK